MERPASQRDWGFDGESILPILTGERGMPERGIGWMHGSPSQAGFRYGRWKFVNNSQSCLELECFKPQLYDLQIDLGETTNLAKVRLRLKEKPYIHSVQAQWAGSEGLPPRRVLLS